ncbi:hypothetical protein [Arthrobacter sp. NEB 688]|uniref:hypothetical protein n=1 Tax=Arthrobacter sp. NEB 688 TaxID=904039 RepID=UPI001567778C|nr:hypothetical protein [Arthrobacter sp. NEB 688]QKE85394.1 hypothetical protein HL663_16615 [Arthrobacter sp. NEB 688]
MEGGALRSGRLQRRARRVQGRATDVAQQHGQRHLPPARDPRGDDEGPVPPLGGHRALVAALACGFSG